jgi:hypothetical protein
MAYVHLSTLSAAQCLKLLIILVTTPRTVWCMYRVFTFSNNKTEYQSALHRIIVYYKCLEQNALEIVLLLGLHRILARSSVLGYHPPW